jgi:hypothetical protein
MNKWFWGVLIFCFFVINEITVDWLLAITIGGYGFEASFEHIFRYSSFFAYFESAPFRLIPYLLLTSLAAFLGGYYSVHEKVAFWGALMAIALFHFWGYWGLHYPSYNGERLSSTAALALLFIPLHAIWVGLLAGIATGLLSLLSASIFKKIRGV